MASGDIYKVEVFYNIGSEVTMNVLHAKEISPSGDDIPAETLAKVIHALWASRYATALFSAEASVTLIRVRRRKPTSGVPATAIIGAAGFAVIEGTGAGDPLPSTSAALISLYTDTHTRNGRGRIYLPGVASGTQNDGQFLAANLALLAAFADDLEDEHVAVAGGTGSWRFVVFSTELQTAAEVKQTVAHSNLATQRGRRNHPGLGV